MADEINWPLWQAALELLDANFHFRSVRGITPPSRSYRLEPNASPIDIEFNNDVIVIKKALVVPQLSHRLPAHDMDGALSHRYRIVELADLELAISRMKGRSPVSGSSPSPSLLLPESAPERHMKAPTNTILYGPPGTRVRPIEPPKWRSRSAMAPPASHAKRSWPATKPCSAKAGSASCELRIAGQRNARSSLQGLSLNMAAPRFV